MTLKVTWIGVPDVLRSSPSASSSQRHRERGDETARYQRTVKLDMGQKLKWSILEGILER